MNQKKFKWRAFVSLFMLFAFIILALTGLVLYISPPGRVAKWVNWRFLTFTKEQWQALHTLFSYCFLIFAVFHIFTLNWRVIVNYIKEKLVRGLRLKRELLVSVILIALVFTGTLLRLPPFQTVMDVGEYFTESWEKSEQRAPMPHTEELTLAELAQKLVDRSADDIISLLRGKDLQVRDENQTLKEIGLENGRSPFEVYSLIRSETATRKQEWSAFGQGSGIGRKTLQEVADAVQVDVQHLVEKLSARGVRVTSGQRIKDIAEQAGETPLEIIEILKK